MNRFFAVPKLGIGAAVLAVFFANPALQRVAGQNPPLNRRAFVRPTPYSQPATAPGILAGSNANNALGGLGGMCGTGYSVPSQFGGNPLGSGGYGGISYGSNPYGIATYGGNPAAPGGSTIAIGTSGVPVVINSRTYLGYYGLQGPVPWLNGQGLYGPYPGYFNGYGLGGGYPIGYPTSYGMGGYPGLGFGGYPGIGSYLGLGIGGYPGLAGYLGAGFGSYPGLGGLGMGNYLGLAVYPGLGATVGLGGL